MSKQTPQFELVPLLEKSGFLFRKFDYCKLDVEWHSHPEYEITFIKQGSGKRIIGNHVSSFKSGDLIIIGPNVPHLFKEENHIQPEVKGAVCYVLQFNNVLFNFDFLSFSELMPLKNFLERSTFGLCFTGITVRKAEQQLIKIDRSHGLAKFIELLRLLTLLANSSEYSVMDKENLFLGQNYDSVKDKAIYNYILKHYTENISVERVAKISNMSKSGFCNYFKRKTQKRFSAFINELRCDLACKYLTETDKSISEIATMVGYENLSYFNRNFIHQFHVQPKKFRVECQNL